MTDFADLIDGVIERQTRSNLNHFLRRYEHIEFGRKRELDDNEITLVLTVIDRFLLDDSFADLGFTEFGDLTEKLSFIASMSDCEIGQRCDEVRRASFDAMASIKALEARLCRSVDQTQITRLARPERPRGANDC